MRQEAKCSIKGCNYGATIHTYIEQREYRLCPKHKFLAYYVQWVSIHG